MRVHLRFAFLIFILKASVSLAMPTKGYWIPRTTTLSFGEIKYDLQVQQGPEKGKPNQNATVLGLAGGFVEWENFYIEAGGDWFEPTEGDLLYGIAGNGRVSYQQVARDGWSVALGIEKFTPRQGQHDDNLFYAVVEAAIGSQWVAAMGGYSGNERRIGTATGALLGVWYKIQMDQGDVGIEWMSGQGKLGYIVPGFRAQVREGFEATLAYAIAADRDTYRNLFLTRLSVYF